MHFGDPERELAAFSSTGSAALVPLPAASTYFHDGADVLDLLHRLTTNDLLSLEPGHAAFTVVTSERGRTIDVLNVAVISPDRLLLLSESTGQQPTANWIDRFTIIEDATLQNASDEYARLALIGPAARDVSNAAFGIHVAHNQTVALTDELDGVYLTASKWGETDRVDLTVPSELAEKVWTELAGGVATPAGSIAFDDYRISHGVPAPGSELNEDTNPLEANLKGLISFTKGCYVGQEVVARLDTYDKLQKRLVRLESAEPLEAGATLTAEGKRAGTVTSVSEIAGRNGAAALGYARRNYWEDGTRLDCDGVEVTVKALPESAPFS